MSVGSLLSRLKKLEARKADTAGFLIVCGDAADAGRARKFLDQRGQGGPFVFVSTGVRNGTEADWLRQSRENRIDTSKAPPPESGTPSPFELTV
jgi:hypothetical protein